MSLTKDQAAFEAEFSKWEKSFETWKQTFSNSADPEVYRTYERKFLEIRDKLLLKKATVYKNQGSIVDKFEQHLALASSMAEDILGNPDYSKPSVKPSVSNNKSWDDQFGPSRFGTGNDKFGGNARIGVNDRTGGFNNEPRGNFNNEPRGNLSGGNFNSGGFTGGQYFNTGAGGNFNNSNNERNRWDPYDNYSRPGADYMNNYSDYNQGMQSRGGSQMCFNQGMRYNPYQGPPNRGSTNDSDFEKIYQIFRRSKTVECPKLSTFSKKNLQRLKKITEDKWTKTDKKFMEYVRYVKWKRGEVFKKLEAERTVELAQKRSNKEAAAKENEAEQNAVAFHESFDAATKANASLDKYNPMDPMDTADNDFSSDVVS